MQKMQSEGELSQTCRTSEARPGELKLSPEGFREGGADSERIPGFSFHRNGN